MFAVWIWICNWRSKNEKKEAREKRTNNKIFSSCGDEQIDRSVSWVWHASCHNDTGVTRDTWHHITSSVIVCHRSHFTLWRDKTREYNPGTQTCDYCALYKSGAVEDKIFMTMFSYAGSLWTPRNINQEILIWLRLSFCKLLDITRLMTSADGMRPCLSWLGSCILLLKAVQHFNILKRQLLSQNVFQLRKCRSLCLGSVKVSDFFWNLALI